MFWHRVKEYHSRDKAQQQSGKLVLVLITGHGPYCRMCSSCLESEDWVKYHPERSIPWYSWNTALLLKWEGCICMGVVSWPFSSLSDATVTYPTCSAFAVSIGGGYLTSLANMNNCHCCVVGFRLFVSNESPTLSDELKLPTAYSALQLCYLKV